MKTLFKRLKKKLTNETKETVITGLKVYIIGAAVESMAQDYTKEVFWKITINGKKLAGSVPLKRNASYQNIVNELVESIQATLTMQIFEDLKHSGQLEFLKKNITILNY